MGQLSVDHSRVKKNAEVCTACYYLMTGSPTVKKKKKELGSKRGENPFNDKKDKQRWKTVNYYGTCVSPPARSYSNYSAKCFSVSLRYSFSSIFSSLKS